MLTTVLVVMGLALLASVVGLVLLQRRTGGVAEARARAEGQLEEARKRVDDQTREIQDLTGRLQEAQSKAGAAEQAVEQLETTFKALATDALRSSNEEFRVQAEESMKRLYAAAQTQLGEKQAEIGRIVEPLSKAIDTYQVQVREMADKGLQAHTAVGEQLRLLSDLQRSMTDETHGLVTVLRGGTGVRGKWGEMTLRRVVELAGMSDFCDFEEQVSTETETGRLRPDMVIHLPDDRDIVVDAKAPMPAYAAAMEQADGDERARLLRSHARAVRDHVAQLATKDYGAQFEHAPDVTVCFLPMEALFSAALEADHELMQFAMEKRVLLATPFTLFALLKAVATSWQQAKLLANAQEIADESKVLFDRVRVFAEHLDGVGDGLRKAVGAHDRAVRSWQARVLPQGRKVQELGVTLKQDLPELEAVDEIGRLTAGDEEDGEE